MAFREIAINFFALGGQAKELNLSVGDPFAWYMDGVMRGRFKEYAGKDVEGVSLVNLNVYDPEYSATRLANSGCAIESNWVLSLNTCTYELELALSYFNGNNEENITKAIELFVKCASESSLPSMQKLASHTQQSIGVNSIDKAVTKAHKEAEKAAKKMAEVEKFLSKNI